MMPTSSTRLRLGFAATGSPATIALSVTSRTTAPSALSVTPKRCSPGAAFLFGVTCTYTVRVSPSPTVTTLLGVTGNVAQSPPVTPTVKVLAAPVFVIVTGYVAVWPGATVWVSAPMLTYALPPAEGGIVAGQESSASTVRGTVLVVTSSPSLKKTRTVRSYTPGFAQGGTRRQISSGLLGSSSSP